MNKEWAEKNKRMQSLIGKEASFREGLDVLLELRDELMGMVSYIAYTFPAEAFYRMPFAGADGYHSKTLAYSMWHIFRIEALMKLKTGRQRFSAARPFAPIPSEIKKVSIRM